MGSPARAEGLIAILLGGSALLAPLSATADVYCCDDESGRQICADVLPAQCYGTAYRILNSQGLVVREVAAPLTREQLQTKREADRQRRLEQDRKRSIRLKERALLAPYRSVEDIDLIEARTIAEVETDLAKARKLAAEHEKEKARLAQEKELYEGKEVPDELTKAITDNRLEISAQQGVIDSKLRLIEAIRKRYAEDRKAYQEILERREALLRR